jgi:hypothetical protein
MPIPCSYCGRQAMYAHNHKRTCPEYRKPTAMERLENQMWLSAMLGKPMSASLFNQAIKEMEVYD